MSLHEVRKIKSLKFNKRDIFVLVQWEDSIFSSKPELAYPGIVRETTSVGNVKHWVVRWDDSWIELSQLNDSSKEWNEFYRETVVPELIAIFADSTPIIIE